jgi:hypothetical protein
MYTVVKAGGTYSSHWALKASVMVGGTRKWPNVGILAFVLRD